MPDYREVRATFDRTSILVYQAYNDSIADAALKAGRFVPPFSYHRMTWIKPSFLWLMARSNWATKTNQTRILGVRITHDGWNEALSAGQLTHFDADIHSSRTAWEDAFSVSGVHVQWDPERSIRGKKLQHRTIQVGLSRAVIERYVQDWTIEIIDETARVQKMRTLLTAGDSSRARRQLPVERLYTGFNAKVAAKLGIGVGPKC